MVGPTIPCLLKEGRGRRGGKQEGAERGSVMRRKRSQKKEQLTVIIVMFNQTPAIKLINTLFPV